MSSESVPVTQHIQLDELVDPFEARLDVYRDDNGAITQVSFDLSGLPRIDGMLVGKRALDVPDITKRLCGLCPVVHHLAGVRAVENLYGISNIPRTAQLIRELLAAGSTLDNLATKFVAVDREGARELKRAGKALMRASGAPSHFPDVAVPGGVRSAADRTLVAEAESALEALAETAVINGAELSASHGASDSWLDTFDGLDVTVVDANGELAPLGSYLAVARHNTDAPARTFPAADWPTRVRETRPGDAAPRPVFDIAEKPGEDGRIDQQADFYRVGPVSRQVVVDKRGMSPRDAQRQLLVDTVEWARRVLADEALLGDHVCDPNAAAAIENADFEGQRSGVGIIDGPRGLLVHRYTAAADGIITDCQIMTPTAQNELWLTRMLTEQLCGGDGEAAGVEESIWAADPCLPCSSAPAGVMTFTMQEQPGAAADKKVTTSRGSAETPTVAERTK
ncbi:nickel-dependent hydrogenase large subunit [uncultured Corynebacterium sp.]|uniref:nickel-dependent hydrogenase large subunit n=1 Tax=uncultured Corynebacterium sp. TaxID=159447 RepID=UPI002622601A|nr:nickel-dependent hydrogenase large subunit [uncultured Corynebacterium sp.]